MKYKQSVLTYIIGNYEQVHEIQQMDDDTEYILVTDNNKITSNTWTVVYDEALSGSTFDRCYEIRFNPFKYVHTDVVLRIDGSIEIKKSLKDLFDKFNDGDYDISLMIHPYRNTMSAEYNEWVKGRNYPQSQADKCLKYIHDELGLADDYKGLYQMCYEIQRNNDYNNRLNRETLDTLKKLGDNGVIERLDQTIFSAILNANYQSDKIMWVNQTLLTNSDYFNWFKHNSTELIHTSYEIDCYAFNKSCHITNICRKHPKLLILSMSCQKQDFIDEENMIRETWAKPILEGKYPNIEWYAYRGGALENCIDKETHTIFVPSNDAFEFTLRKTIQCFDYINHTFDFDYIIRTNCCTYLNINKLYDLINDNLDANVIYTNETHCIETIRRNDWRTSWRIRASGSFLLLNKYIYNYLLHQCASISIGVDDDIFSIVLDNFYNKLHNHIFLLPSSYLEDNNDISKVYSIKLKSFNNNNIHSNCNVVSNFKKVRNKYHKINTNKINPIVFYYNNQCQRVLLKDYKVSMNDICEKYIDILSLIDDNSFYANKIIDLNDSFRFKTYNELKCAIFCMVKNENRYLREWVEHHLKLGFDKIYINDNNDIEGEKPIKVLKDYIMNGQVVIINRRGEKIKRIGESGLQEICMEECYNMFAKDFDWVSVIDIDEFITLDKKFNNSIKQFLSQSVFKNTNIIKMKWKVMTDNNNLFYENKSIIKRFNKGSQNHKYSIQNKSIYRTCIKDFKMVAGTHTICNKNEICCTADGRYLAQNDCCNHILNYNDCYIKHFQTKTLEEYVNRSLFNRLAWATIPNNYISKLQEEFFDINERTPEKEALFNKYLEEYNKSLREPKELPMMSEDNTKIFILGYKNFKCPVHNSKLYSIVDVKNDDAIRDGAIIDGVEYNYDIPIIYTSEKNSISDKNEIYDEWCGIYWLWKNYKWKDVEYIGLCQYRRYFEFLDHPAFDILTQTDTVVGGSSEQSNNNGIMFQLYHNVDELTKLIQGFAQEDIPAARSFVLSNVIYPSNLVLLSKEQFFDYCAFVFGYIKKYQTSQNLYSTEDIINRVKSTLDKYASKGSEEETIKYQKQLLAFLMERLSNIWIQKQIMKGKGVLKVSCIETEHTGQGVFKYKDITDAAKETKEG